MKIRFITTILLILLVNSLFGQVGYNEEFQIIENSDQYKFLENLKLCELANGNIVICWNSLDLYYQINNSEFEKLSPVKKISRDNYELTHESNIAAFPDSGYVICWKSDNPLAIYFQFFNNSGDTLGEPVLVAEGIWQISRNIKPSATVLRNGNVVVVWECISYQNERHQILASMFDRNGNKLSDMIVKEDHNISENSNYPKIETISSDRFIIFWADKEDKKIYGQIFNNNCVKNGNKIWIAGRNCADPKIALLSDGNFVISWRHNWGTVLAQIYNTSGEKVSTEISINSCYAASSGITSISGKFIINYQFFFESYSYGIIAKLFNNDGTDYKKQVLITNEINNWHSYPKSIGLSNDKFIVIWEKRDKGGYFKGYLAKYYYTEPVMHELSRFRIISPKTDETLFNNKPNFNWNTSCVEHLNLPWDITYNIYIYKGNYTSSPIIYKNIQDTTFQLPDTLEKGKVYYWKVQAVNWEYDSLWSSNVNGFFVSHDAEVGIDEDETVLSEFSLAQNYPNPFNNSTMINYQLATGSDVRLSVFDMKGREITTLVNKNQNVGNYSVQFDGSGLSSGIYFYRLSVDENIVATKKMILLK